MSLLRSTFALENRKNEDYEKMDDIKRLLGDEPDKQRAKQ